ncbi:MAG: hypothetical protein R3C00_06500 [Hyphomonas sp.]|nr:hypothetical protein [Hyphomonas sp.]
MRRVWVLFVGMGSVAGAAEAGPWAQAPGGIYARAIASAERLDGEDGWRGDVYAEYGLRHRVTLTVKAESVRYEGGGISDRDAYRFSARKQLWADNKGWALGMEAAAVNGSAVAGVFGCSGWGAEARLAGGRSGVRKGRGYYFFGDAAYIAHEDGCTRQRLELGYGADLGGHFFTTQQVWLERGNHTARSVKFDTQAGYHFRAFDLSLGYRQEAGGAFNEQAYLVAVTVRR